MNPESPKTDLLTGLLSRRTFEGQFTSAFDQAQAGKQTLSLAFLDIDLFKPFNDRYGHAAGDVAIEAVADTIRAFAGDDTISARYGGEEFALLFRNTEREQAFLTVERIRADMEKKREFKVQGDVIEEGLTVSAGVAAYPVDARSERELLRKADQALYRAKVTGRNRICLAHEERMVTKTTHYTPTHLERLAKLAQTLNLGEAELLREALDDLLIKHGVADILS